MSSPPPTTNAPFAYTVGLTALAGVEFVMCGLPGDVAQEFLNDIGQQVRDGRRFSAGEVTTDLTENGGPLAFIAVDDDSELTAVEQVYGGVTALQVVWSDGDGHFPWDAEYGISTDAQPLLGARR